MKFYIKIPIAFGLTACTLALLTLLGGVNTAQAQGEIVANVNNSVITKYQLTQRSRFLRLTGRKGELKDIAMKELIDEELQLQEAKRVDYNLPENSVERAYGNIAKRLKRTPAQFSSILRQNGVNPNTLKRRIRAQILWQQIVQARASAKPSTRKKDDITAILFNRTGDGKNRKVKEYTLERFVFVTKRDASEGLVKQRFREAETFKRTYKSCKDASERAKALKDVVVTQLGRFTIDTLPADIKDDVLKTEVGNFTNPKKGELGIGLMAVCKQREIVDNSSRSDLNAGQLTNEAFQENSKKWMGEMHDRSDIKIRN